MGALVADGYVPHVQDQINSRFAAGDALREMVGFQKEFKLFSLQHSLKSAFTLLNIAPGNLECGGAFQQQLFVLGMDQTTQCQQLDTTEPPN